MIIYQAENAAIRMCVCTCISICAVKYILKEQFSSYTLILTAPIHCKESISEQVM